VENGVLLMRPDHAAAPLQGSVMRELEDWDRNAEFYIQETRSPVFRLITETKVKTYGLDCAQQPLIVLDLGSGPGYFTSRLISWGHTGVALDFSKRMLQLGRQAYSLPLCIHCTSTSLPFVDDALDAVVLNGVLHHCKAQAGLRETVCEVSRVLKRGGLLLVYDRNGAFLGRQLHRFVMVVKGLLERRTRFPTSSSRSEPDFNDQDIRLLLEEGFVVEQRRYVATLVTFIAVVVTNSFAYAGLPRLASWLRTALYPMCYLAEKVLPFRQVTVEQCLRLRKTSL